MEVKNHVEVETKPKKKKVTAEVEERGKKVKKVVEVEEPGKMVKKVVTEEVEKEVVFVNDTSAFLLDVMHQRRMDPAKSLVRIGLDGGKGSFKVMASICDAEQEAEEEEEEEGRREAREEEPDSSTVAKGNGEYKDNSSSRAFPEALLTGEANMKLGKAFGMCLIVMLFYRKFKPIMIKI